MGGISQQSAGVAALLGYCVATAVSATWVSFSFTGVSGPALTFVTFAVAQCVYTARVGRDFAPVRRFVLEHWKGTALLNVLTLSSWLFMFMALQRMEASVESAVYQGAVAVMGFVLAYSLAGQRFPAATRCGLVLTVVALGLLVAVRLTADGSPLHGRAAQGLALALIAGSTGGCYIYYSSILHRRADVSTLAVLSVRFILLLVVTALLGVADIVRLLRSDPDVLGRLLILAIAFVVLPTFLLQFAISRLPAVRVAVLTPLVPIIALGSEYAVRPWGNVITPLLVVAASVSLIFTNQTLGRTPRSATAATEESRKEKADATAGD